MRELKKNTTSLYLMNEVFYMLHPLIANGICSLNENVDRLTLSVIITLSSLGEVIDYKIEESVINSKKKTSYEKCNKYLDEGIVEEGYEEVLDTLDLSKEISDKIDEIRCRRGFLPFSSNEIDFDTDPDGKVISINNRISGSSEKIIENFMLLADYCYADYMIRMYQTIIRRVHDAPKKEKIKEAISTIKSLGYKIRPIKDYSDQHALKKVMDGLKDNDAYSILSDIILCSMERARYSTDERGHYALGSEYHAHFTAAIRRFVDLVAHHMVHDILSGKMNCDKEGLDELEKELSGIANRATYYETMSDKAEEEAKAMEMATVMEDKIGEYFNGRVSNISLYGLKVRTENGIRGFVSCKDILSGNYKYDKNRKVFILDDGSIIKVSDLVRLKLIRASREDRAIDFKLLQVLDKPKTKKLKK